MASKSRSRTLTDHNEIRRWAEERAPNLRLCGARTAKKIPESFASIFPDTVERIHWKRLIGMSGSRSSKARTWLYSFRIRQLTANKVISTSWLAGRARVCRRREDRKGEAVLRHAPKKLERVRRMNRRPMTGKRTRLPPERAVVPESTKNRRQSAAARRQHRVFTITQSYRADAQFLQLRTSSVLDSTDSLSAAFFAPLRQ